MEIKAKLNKPYSATDRSEFIVEQNHNLGYELKETEEALEAWGFTEEEQEEQERERINNLKMTALDFLNVLKSFGFTDAQVEAYLDANLNLKHQLQYCQNVYCGVAKALMPIEYEGITITADMVEAAFIHKGE